MRQDSASENVHLNATKAVLEKSQILILAGRVCSFCSPHPSTANSRSPGGLNETKQVVFGSQMGLALFSVPAVVRAPLALLKGVAGFGSGAGQAAAIERPARRSLREASGVGPMQTVVAGFSGK